jgi:hypothetical protein
MYRYPSIRAINLQITRSTLSITLIRTKKTRLIGSSLSLSPPHKLTPNNNMPPKKKGNDKKKPAATKPKPKPKPKRQLHPGEVQKKHLGASHGDVQRAGDKIFD